MGARVIPKGLWIVRPQEKRLERWFDSKQSLYWPLSGPGGSGKSSLLNRFRDMCAECRVPVAWIEPEQGIREQGPLGLTLLCALQTRNTPRFDKARRSLLDNLDKSEYLDLASSSALRSAVDNMGDAESRKITAVAWAVLDSGLAALKIRRKRTLDQLTRQPEAQLLQALYEDMKKGGVWLVDTWEKVGQADQISSTLSFQQDGMPLTLGKGNERVLPVDEWLEGIASMFSSRPVLWVTVGRNTSLGLAGLPIVDLVDDNCKATPFSETEIADYLCRFVSGLPKPDAAVSHDLLILTKGNPFLVDRLGYLLRGEKLADSSWSWKQWPALRDVFPRDDKYGLAAFALQRLTHHCGLPDMPLWRLALPLVLHRDVADILFPAETGLPVHGQAAFRKLYDLGLLIQRRDDRDAYALHDLDREALNHLAMAVDAEQRLAQHRALADFWDKVAKPSMDTRLSAATRAASYHRLHVLAHGQDSGLPAAADLWASLDKCAVVSPLNIRGIVTNMEKRDKDRRRKMVGEIDKVVEYSAELDDEARQVVAMVPHLGGQYLKDQGIDWRSVAARYPANPLLVEVLVALEGLTEDEVDGIYAAAVMAGTTDPIILGNYALFTEDVRKDMDGAERLYRAAQTADPGYANNLRNFAVFMERVRKDVHEAENLYRAAVAADPQDAWNLGNLAVFMETVRQDMDEAERLYRAAEAVDPRHAWNLSYFADFMERVRKNPDEAERLYRAAEAANPRHARSLGDFAVFMETVRQDMDEAERLYRAAEAADPHDARNLGNFAHFMETGRKDMGEAERLYRAAEAADPGNARNLGFFALFMQYARQDMDEAERLYRAAEAADPGHARNLGLSALFMQYVRMDMDEAERLYRAAEAADPRYARNLGNFAAFMHFGRKDMVEAERLYRAALAIDPEDAFCLGNFAWFMQSVHKDLDEAEHLFRAAEAADLGNVRNLGLFALFMQYVRQDLREAERLFRAAEAADPGHVDNLEGFGIFMQVVRRDMAEAERLYRAAVAVDAGRANVLGNLACILIADGREGEAAALVGRGLDEAVLHGFRRDLILECWFYRYAVYPEWRERALGEMAGLIGAGVRSPGWDLRGVVARGEALGHPRPDLLRAVAAVIVEEAEADTLAAFGDWPKAA